MTFVDRLSPYVVHWQMFGHTVGLRWYGLAYLLSFVLAYVFLRRASRRGDIPGLTQSGVETLSIYLVVGVMVGGRLGFVVQQPGKLLHDPLFLISIWEGGMAFFGGLAGVMLAVCYFCWRRGFAFSSFADVCALPACLGLGTGRIANFVNGELYGKPTHAGWGVVFPGGGLEPRHPSQLYESASHFLLFFILYWLYERTRGRTRPGLVACMFLFGYGLLRFITDFYRQDDVYWGPLSDGQWFSLAVALAGLISFLIWRTKPAAPATAAPGSGEKAGSRPAGASPRGPGASPRGPGATASPDREAPGPR